MQQQSTVSELRAASDEAVAAAQAGLGPLFASHLQTQLLERPQDFVNDQVPLVSAAARARLALLDAEAAETDAATTPAALKRLLEREVSKVLGAQEQFEARVGEKLDELRTRVEKGEEAVHQLVTVKGAELRDELTRLAAQQHEKSATELVEKMGAFRGEFQVAMMGAQAEIEKLRAQVAQLELRVLPGTGLAIDYKPLFKKLGYGAGTTVDDFKRDIVKKTELKYSGKGLDADDMRALAVILCRQHATAANLVSLLILLASFADYAGRRHRDDPNFSLQHEVAGSLPGRVHHERTRFSSKSASSRHSPPGSPPAAARAAMTRLALAAHATTQAP